MFVYSIRYHVDVNRLDDQSLKSDPKVSHWALSGSVQPVKGVNVHFNAKSKQAAPVSTIKNYISSITFLHIKLYMIQTSGFSIYDS